MGSSLGLRLDRTNLRQSPLPTHCDDNQLRRKTTRIVVEKNYRLQDIQLSKNRLALQRLARKSLPTCQSGRQPKPLRGPGEDWWRIPGSNR